MLGGFDKKGPDWKHVILLTAAVLCSAFVGWRFQPLIADNKDAVNTIVTIFSILAGFLIAVIGLITEPALKQAKTFDDLQIMKNAVVNKLRRQQLLFYFYLITLGLAFVMFLIPDEQAKTLKVLQSLFLGFSCFVFLCSFTLPSSLMRLQVARYDASLNDLMPKALKRALGKDRK